MGRGVAGSWCPPPAAGAVGTPGLACAYTTRRGRLTLVRITTARAGAPAGCPPPGPPLAAACPHPAAVAADAQQRLVAVTRRPAPPPRQRVYGGHGYARCSHMAQRHVGVDPGGLCPADGCATVSL